MSTIDYPFALNKHFIEVYTPTLSLPFLHLSYVLSESVIPVTNLD